jgi:hypothetical protein
MRLAGPLLALICLMSAHAALAERYTDQPSALQIEVPEKWKLDEAKKHTTITSPDNTVTMLVVSMRHFTSADDCINKLDRDVMGGRIKSVETQGEAETKKINTLEAKIYKGRFNFANERRQFRALVILVPKTDVAYVAFVFGEKEGMKEHEATVTKAWETIRKRPD